MSPTSHSSRRQEPALSVLLDGRVIGHVFQTPTGRLRFIYEKTWQSNDDSYPLSLSMPLTSMEHDHKAIQAYLWGLLPDNERTLDRYGRMFGVSTRNPVALLAHIGADCAGAVQLIPPSRLAEIMDHNRRVRVAWISEEEIAHELRSVKETGLPGRDARTVGRFSLAGAQPKIALFNKQERWGRPEGRTPTTHILKPPSEEYPGFAENEHLCLDLASELGLGAAKSAVRRFGDQVAIVVERFDRRQVKSVYQRIHQEDICQALAIVPWNKYESEGGPGAADVVALLQESSYDPVADVDRFIDVLALNWVLAAPDGHAKNYGIIHVPGGSIRLAPFYDIASYLPYADQRLHKVKLAMRVGKEYLVHRIARRDWLALAHATRLPPDYVIERLERLFPRIPDAVLDVAQRAIKGGLDRRFVEPLAGRIIERSAECLKPFAAR